MNVHVDIAGNAADRTIIFIHGAGGSTATWTMQLRGLSDSFKVVTIDLNGHGKTPDRNVNDPVASYLKDIDEIVQQYSRPILAGHSMGGMLTQLYALQHPTILKGIILIGTGAKLRVMPAIFKLLKNDFDGYVSAASNFMFDTETSSELIEASQAEIRKCRPEIIIRDFQACDVFNIMDRVSDIKIPTLIIVGRNDVMTPIKYSQYLHDNIPNSELRIIDGAGHAVMLEKSRLMNKAIENWANSLV